jgi:putative acetyltransferase
MKVERLKSPSREEQRDIKTLTLKRLEEFGFKTAPELDYDLDKLEQEYIAEGGAVFVVKDVECIVGSILVRKIADVGEVKRFQILPEYRSRGLGKQLLDAAISFMKESGFRRSILDTTEKSPEAIKLFLNTGFQESKREGSRIYFEKNF